MTTQRTLIDNKMTLINIILWPIKFLSPPRSRSLDISPRNDSYIDSSTHPTTIILTTTMDKIGNFPAYKTIVHVETASRELLSDVLRPQYKLKFISFHIYQFYHCVLPVHAVFLEVDTSRKVDHAGT